MPECFTPKDLFVNNHRDEGTAKFPEIAAINNVELLEAIASQIPTINSPKELVR